ncbi:EthD family reductase [Mesorhizobium sp. BR1-1-2]|uniref:EthD family reductase n=2 Tax=unclassified Mesorhizobium TaxID=325217 RepID=UPI001CCB0FA6|nr:EthD family reductase [Mesorhizobium sp. BR1-1-2]MBZ9964654.1 EthD family reductase [Mesorhizobium sp. BR1-1-2]
MIVSTSLIRRREDISPAAFKSHWLDPHGPLTAKLPGARKYDQNHVVADAPGTNDAARRLRVDGFPVLAFDSPESRRLSHGSPEMAACNKDSLFFIGAVARVISDDGGAQAPAGSEAAIKQLLLVPGDRGVFALPDVIAELDGVLGSISHTILEQGAAPSSAVPFIGFGVSALAELWVRDDRSVVANAARLEREAPEVATFAVQVHRFF